MRSLKYLSQGPAVSKRLCIIDFDVAGCGHVVHCHTVKVSTQSTEKALVDKEMADQFILYSRNP